MVVHRVTRSWAAAALAALAGWLLTAEVAGAQSLEDQIGSALLPKTTVPTRSLTRSITVDPKAAAAAEARSAADRALVDQLRSRSISVEPAPRTSAEREQIAAFAAAKPAIDLEILFDYDSAVVGPKAAPVLGALGRALSRPELKGSVFLINGYTDAKGSADYNQALSQRRADAVRRALIEQFRLQPDTLIATGFGKEQLKNPANPLGEENRRVQIVNTTVTGSK
jgi:outer membrane protein OmpA-like peptidoglycan-associated protein